MSAGRVRAMGVGLRPDEEHGDCSLGGRHSFPFSVMGGRGMCSLIEIDAKCEIQ
jgi:hypothetical protein